MLARSEDAGGKVLMVERVSVVLGHQTDPAPLLVQLALLPPEAAEEVGGVELQAGLVAPHLQPPTRGRVLQRGHVAVYTSAQTETPWRMSRARSQLIIKWSVLSMSANFG